MCRVICNKSHIVFLQPFGIGSNGGGARILRAMLQNAPMGWTSITSSLDVPLNSHFGREIHLPYRPGFGRLETTRLNPLFLRLDVFFQSLFSKRLKKLCIEFGATAIHSIPHGLDFIAGWHVSKQLGCEFFLSIHDDLAFCLKNHPLRQKALDMLPEIWRGAAARFVISDKLGAEYCKRYGNQKYEIITDGLEKISSPRPRNAKRLNIYFMGLFHISYERNLLFLLDALKLLSAYYPDMEWTITMRGVKFRRGFPVAAGIRLLPFGSEADVESDMKEADMLYLPLPFEVTAKDFIRFSLSTKMVTYLGSGLPIFYHGPGESATSKLLAEDRAAIQCHSLNPWHIALTLREFIDFPDRAGEMVENAAVLANRMFLLKDLRDRFWGAIGSWAA